MLWEHRGKRRPDFAEPTGPGQESVWDYPRPPALAPDDRVVRVEFAGEVIAETRRAVRLLETASAPGFYIPPADVVSRYLRQSSSRSICEWKGAASYFDIVSETDEVRDAAWAYLRPLRRFDQIAGFISFYPAKARCYVDGELVVPQPGGFYGGWLTSEIVGPVKGAPGTGGW